MLTKCTLKGTVKPEFALIFKSSFCQCQIIILQYQSTKSDLNVLIFNIFICTHANYSYRVKQLAYIIYFQNFIISFTSLSFKETVKPEFAFIFKSSICQCQIIISQYQSIKFVFNVLNLIFNRLTIDIYDISHF